MIILGINAFHGDSAAAILDDGKLVAAAEEERFRRLKHWAGFPSESIAYCLEEAGVSLRDVDHVAINQNSHANILGKLRFLCRNRPAPRLVLSRLRNRKARDNLAELLEGSFPGHAFQGQFHNVEHHVAHLSSAFHVSPFDTAAIVSVDGFGDFSSAAWGVGNGVTLSIDGRVYFPHSLGIFYQALTQYLGFPHYGDEYKVMGLAPYGAPAYVTELRDILSSNPDGSFDLNLNYFRHHKELISFEWKEGPPEFTDLFTPALESLLGPRRRTTDPLERRHRDLAHSIQSLYEEVFFNLLNVIHARHGLTDIALAGGCAMNSVANGKVRRMTPFRRVYVQSAAGDAGGAIGAAFDTWHRQGGQRSFVMSHAYWGPQFGTPYIKNLLESESRRIHTAGCTIARVVDEADMCRETAAAIAEGKVVGWFQGAMEWGPRALGNRSILADPRRADIKDVLNAKIKRRESFRPFAPSVLAEAVSDWFEENDDVPFMMQVFQVREEKRASIPAVTHVDGSGRLHTVTLSSNPLYHTLISEFDRMTGVPMLLNTSFNENEPVVCKPEEALDCFLRTNMDIIVMGQYIVRRDAHSSGLTNSS